MFLNRDPLNVRLNLKRVSFVVIKISQIKITHINMNWRHDVATKIWRAADVVTWRSLNICGEKTGLYILLKFWTPLTLWLIIMCWNFHLNQASNSNFITFVLELLDNPTYTSIDCDRITGKYVLCIQLSVHKIWTKYVDKLSSWTVLCKWRISFFQCIYVLCLTSYHPFNILSIFLIKLDTFSWNWAHLFALSIKLCFNLNGSRSESR